VTLSEMLEKWGVLEYESLAEDIRSYGDARFAEGLEAAIVEFCGTVCHCRTAERIRALAAQPPPSAAPAGKGET
jgi:hypothetical protein